MKKITLIVSLFSVSILAQDPCEGLKTFASLSRLETDPAHACKLEFDDVKDRMVVRQPGYPGLTTLEEVAAHEINHRKWCGLGGHFYVEADGRITEGRPEYMKGANEINDADGNTGKMGIQVLLPEGQTELSAYFVGNFTQLVACQMTRHMIFAKDVKPHFHSSFHPGAPIAALLERVKQYVQQEKLVEKAILKHYEEL